MQVDDVCCCCGCLVVCFVVSGVWLNSHTHFHKKLKFTLSVLIFAGINFRGNFRG